MPTAHLLFEDGLLACLRRWDIGVRVTLDERLASCPDCRYWIGS